MMTFMGPRGSVGVGDEAPRGQAQFMGGVRPIAWAPVALSGPTHCPHYGRWKLLTAASRDLDWRVSSMGPSSGLAHPP